MTCKKPYFTSLLEYKYFPREFQIILVNNSELAFVFGTKRFRRIQAYMNKLEEIKLSEGLTGAVISEPHRISENLISVANLIDDVGKTMDPAKNSCKKIRGQ